MHFQRIHKSARNCFTHYLSNINITLKLGTSLCWGLTCDRLVSHPGGLDDLHLLCIKDNGNKRLMRLHGTKDDLTLITKCNKQMWHYIY